MTETVEPTVDVNGYSPLSKLMATALAVFGDSHYDMADGGLAHLLLLMANNVVGDINRHPYRTGMTRISHYTHPEDTRPINDLIMISGIAAYYAGQQVSAKMQTLMAQYYQQLNGILWDELNGNTKISLRAFDKVETSPLNGQPIYGDSLASGSEEG